MIDTSTDEYEDDEFVSRTKRRAVRKDNQARLEGMTMILRGLRDPILVELDLGEELTKEVRLFAKMSVGGAFARQRRRIASLLRVVDMDELEPRVRALSEHS